MSCYVGTETAWSAVQSTTGLWSESDEANPATCRDTYLYVDYQYGSSSWSYYAPPWNTTYGSVTWHRDWPSLVLGPVTVWGQHNTCNTGFTNCNGYIDTSAEY